MTPASLCLNAMPTVFHSQILGEMFLFPELEPWAGDSGIYLGHLTLQRELHSQDISPDFYRPYVYVGPAHCTSPPLLPVYSWLLLHIHSYRTFVQLDFRQFLMIAFCSLIVILMWSWEEASTVISHPAIMTRTQFRFLNSKSGMFSGVSILSVSLLKLLKALLSVSASEALFYLPSLCVF